MVKCCNNCAKYDREKETCDIYNEIIVELGSRAVIGWNSHPEKENDCKFYEEYKK